MRPVRTVAPSTPVLLALALSTGCGSGDSPTRPAGLAAPRQPPIAASILTGVEPAPGGFSMRFADGSRVALDVTSWTCYSDVAGCTGYFAPPPDPGVVSCAGPTVHGGGLTLACTAPGFDGRFTFSPLGSFDLSLGSQGSTLRVEGMASMTSVGGTWSLASSRCPCQGSGSFSSSR